MTVDLFVKSCVGFTIYFYCCLSVSNLNSFNSLYGVYLVNFSLLVVLYIHIFSECVLMFRNWSVILVEYGEYVLAFFVPRDFWDYLCPRAWDHLCPAFMELRVNLRCQIVCVFYYHIFSECVLMFSQLICHFGRIWRICFGLFCAKRFLGLSVPSSMGPSVPSFHGVAS